MGLKTRNRIWEHSNQTSSDLLLLLAIAEHADDDGVCWPGIPTLAQKTRCSKRQTQRNIEKLVERGELYISRRCGRGNSNLYFVTIGLTLEQIANTLQFRFEIEGNTEDIAQNIIRLQSFCNRPKGDTDDTIYQEEKVTSRVRKGDIQGQKVTSRVRKGDIAMSPEPLEPSLEPSSKPIGETPPPSSPKTIPSVKIFVEVTGKYCLNNTQIDELQKVVGDTPIALEKWRGVVKAWRLRNYNITNISGMLDWFRDGIPVYKNGAYKNETNQRSGNNRPLQRTGEEIQGEPTLDIYTNEYVYPDGRRVSAVS